MIPNFDLTKDYIVRKDVKPQFRAIAELVKDADVIYNA